MPAYALGDVQAPFSYFGPVKAGQGSDDKRMACGTCPTAAQRSGDHRYASGGANNGDDDTALEGGDGVAVDEAVERAKKTAGFVGAKPQPQCPTGEQLCEKRKRGGTHHGRTCVHACKSLLLLLSLLACFVRGLFTLPSFFRCRSVGLSGPRYGPEQFYFAGESKRDNRLREHAYPDAMRLELLRGYCASVSFMDKQVRTYAVGPLD